MKKKFFMTALFSLFLFVAVQASIEVTTSCGEVYITCACFDEVEDLLDSINEMNEILCGERAW